MPGFDGTGPFGTGPYGRGLGPCGGGVNGPRVGRYFPRMGMGYGRRGGMGYYPAAPAISPEDEKAALARQEELLKQEMEYIAKRRQELEK